MNGDSINKKVILQKIKDTIPKFQFITYIVTKPNVLKSMLRYFIPLKWGRILRNFIVTKNVIKKPLMNYETRNALNNFFRDVILKLQELLGIDLAHWLDLDYHNQHCCR